MLDMFAFSDPFMVVVVVDRVLRVGKGGSHEAPKIKSRYLETTIRVLL